MVEKKEEYLDKGVKEVISKFPEVADILNEYNIGCASCSVGTCLLKDIVDIHNLSGEEEYALLRKIYRVIYSDGKVQVPKIERKKIEGHRKIRHSPPIEKLVDEHKLIRRLVVLIPQIIQRLDLREEKSVEIVKGGVDFIRNYADKYHHAKEEDILFKYFNKDLDIIKAMYKEHETARDYVKSILEAIDKKDTKMVIEILKEYGALLDEHIKKEDEILYPWMDRSFSITQIGELFRDFNIVDERLGHSAERYEQFIKDLEERFKISNLEV